MPDCGEIEIAGTLYDLAEKVDGNYYTATLRKDADTIYTVANHHGAWYCTCPAQKYRRGLDGNCKHILRLQRRREEQAEDARNPVPIPVALPPERQQYQEIINMPAAAEATTPDVVRDARGLNTTRPAPQQVIPAPAQQSPSLPSSQSGRTQLCIALAKAQSAVGRLAHDARNEFHKYDYTSSEAVIEAAKSALGSNGLSLLPLEETLNGYEREGENRFELVCKFVLLHQSGEVQPLLRHWPVCPDKGRPLDKATAAASTLCLCYLLRDLLLIPRVNSEDEVAARDDRQQQQATRPAKPAKPARPEPPKTGAELTAALDRLDAWGVKESLWKAGWLIGCIMTDADAERWPADMTMWQPEQVREAHAAAREYARREKDKRKQAPATPGKTQAPAPV